MDGQTCTFDWDPRLGEDHGYRQVTDRAYYIAQWGWGLGVLCVLFYQKSMFCPIGGLLTRVFFLGVNLNFRDTVHKQAKHTME